MLDEDAREPRLHSSGAGRETLIPYVFQ